MSVDTADKASPPPSGGVEADFAIRKIYVKDVSFESPNAPQVFATASEPEVEIHLNTAVNRLADTEFEVALTATVTVRHEGTTAYLVEAQLAGLFGVAGVREEDMGPVLGSYCPSLLFPYLRETVSDLSVRGGFPSLQLAPVNFEALYQQHVQSHSSQLGADSRGKAIAHGSQPP